MTEQKLGVHSESGKLRQVIICRPGLAHRRLTPDNCEDLLFDDVFWVKQAQKDHDAFGDAMRGEGVEVLETGALLAETMDIKEARNWVLDRRIAAIQYAPRVARMDGRAARPRAGEVPDRGFDRRRRTF